MASNCKIRAAPAERQGNPRIIIGERICLFLRNQSTLFKQRIRELDKSITQYKSEKAKVVGITVADRPLTWTRTCNEWDTGIKRLVAEKALLCSREGFYQSVQQVLPFVHALYLIGALDKQPPLIRSLYARFQAGVLDAKEVEIIKIQGEVLYDGAKRHLQNTRSVPYINANGPIPAEVEKRRTEGQIAEQSEGRVAFSIGSDTIMARETMQELEQLLKEHAMCAYLLERFEEEHNTTLIIKKNQRLEEYDRHHVCPTCDVTMIAHSAGVLVCPKCFVQRLVMDFTASSNTTVFEEEVELQENNYLQITRARDLLNNIQGTRPNCKCDLDQMLADITLQYVTDGLIGKPGAINFSRTCDYMFKLGYPPKNYSYAHYITQCVRNEPPPMFTKEERSRVYVAFNKCIPVFRKHKDTIFKGKADIAKSRKSFMNYPFFFHNLFTMWAHMAEQHGNLAEAERWTMWTDRLKYLGNPDNIRKHDAMWLKFCEELDDPALPPHHPDRWYYLKTATIKVERGQKRIRL